MNRPAIKPYEEQAMEIVIRVINHAKEKLGMRQSLGELVQTAEYAWANNKVSMKTLESPFTITAEKLIINTIENIWHLTDVFMYHLKYIGGSKDEVSKYYYFEAIFSQPTAAYPIPQATVSVYFRIEEKHLDQTDLGAPLMHFRIEGHHTDHDIRFVVLSPDWLLAMIKMKIKFYKRVEDLRLF